MTEYAGPLARFRVGRMAGLCWALLAIAGMPPAIASDGPLEGLDGFIAEARATRDNVGLAVAVVQGDQVLYAKGFGVREVGGSAQVDADTLFQIGSTSKAFGVAALAALVDEGKLDWDDPVIRHMPDFQLTDPWLTRHLTVRDTVLHRTGYRDTLHYVMAIMGQDEVVRQLRHFPPEQRFRDSYIYSNLMFGVAGAVVESVSGMPWREFVRSRLLEPLEMRRTGLTAYEFWDAQHVAPTFSGSAPAGKVVGARHARADNLAMPHSYDEDGRIVPIQWGNFDNAGAAGSVVSSANDMAKWLRMHLNQGRHAGRQVLEADTVREMHAGVNTRLPADFPLTPGLSAYAMGWRRGDYRGHPHLEHGGSMIGFPAYVAMLPEQGVGVVVLSNGPRGARDSFTLHKTVAYEVFDRFIGGGQEDWIPAFLDMLQQGERDVAVEEAQLQRDRIAGTRPTLPLQAYAGRYEDGVLQSGPVQVTLEGGELKLSFEGAGALSAYLEHWHQDMFRLRGLPGAQQWLTSNGFRFITFELGADGRVQSFRGLGTAFERK